MGIDKHRWEKGGEFNHERHGIREKGRCPNFLTTKARRHRGGIRLLTRIGAN